MLDSLWRMCLSSSFMFVFLSQILGRTWKRAFLLLLFLRVIYSPLEAPRLCIIFYFVNCVVTGALEQKMNSRQGSVVELTCGIAQRSRKRNAWVGEQTRAWGVAPPPALRKVLWAAALIHWKRWQIMNRTSDKALHQGADGARCGCGTIVDLKL